jgi:hypothetical protein
VAGFRSALCQNEISASTKVAPAAGAATVEVTGVWSGLLSLKVISVFWVVAAAAVTFDLLSP